MINNDSRLNRSIMHILRWRGYSCLRGVSCRGYMPPIVLRRKRHCFAHMHRYPVSHTCREKDTLSKIRWLYCSFSVRSPIFWTASRSCNFVFPYDNERSSRLKYCVHKMFSIMLLTPELAQTLAISRPRAWSSAPSYFVHTIPCLSYYQEVQDYAMEMLAAACSTSKERLEPLRKIRWQHQSYTSICKNVK